MTRRRDEPDDVQPENLIAVIAQTRDKDAFARLFAHFAPTIKAYLRRTGCADGEAEELTQETMLAVWRKAHQFDGERATAAAWIFAIARNLRIDGLRRRPETGFTEPVEATPSPDESFADGRALARLRAALSNLPPEQVAVIRAAYVDHRTHGEIAATLGLPLGTVKSRLRLALKRLRAELEPPHDPTPSPD